MSRPIAEVVAAARARTGKDARSSDDELAAWLEAQEVTSEAELLGLSDVAFATVAQAPGASLVLLDALRQLREEALGQRIQGRRLSRADLSFDDAAEAASASAAPVVTLIEAGKRQVVEIKVQGFVGTIMMCNDAKRNAFSTDVCDQMREGIRRCCAAGVRVIVLRARPGVKVWSAGHDIRDFKRIDGSAAQTGSSKFQDPLSREDSFVQLLAEMTRIQVPLLGCVEGSVWGAATDICACCDCLVGTPTASFAITPAKIGLPYNASGMSHFVQVMPLHVVKWMFFSGEPISAEEALRVGFLNEVVPAEQLTEKIEDMALIIASRAPLVVSLLKKQILCIASTPNMAPEVFEELHEMRRQTWNSNDMEEGIQAFFSKRKPVFRGD